MQRDEQAESVNIGQAVRFAVGGRRLALSGVALTAFIGGTLEALFLVIVARVALEITEGSAELELADRFSISVNEALLVGVVLLVARAAVGIFSNWQTARITTSSVASARSRLAAAFVHASFETQQRQRSGGLQEYLSSFASRVSQLTSALSLIILSSANLAALIVFAIVTNPVGALAMILSGLVLAGALRPVRRAITARSREAIKANMSFATATNEISGLSLEMQVHGVQDEVLQHVERQIDVSRGRAMRVAFISGLSTPIYIALGYLAVLAALAVVSAASIDDVGSLGAVFLVMLRSLSYGQALQSSYAQLLESAPATHELRRTAEDLEANAADRGHTPLPTRGAFAFDAVSFEYEVGHPAVSNMSFELQPHTLVGVIGPSGSGKSTLVHLLLGLRSPTSGTVTLDGVDVSEIDRASWVRGVTFVPQAASLIRGTIADNIRFFRPDISDERVTEAARQAGLHDEIISLPDGYDRVVGDGSQLSGGQRQRLCIARALVERPRLLILDEPTSALDAIGERVIRDTLHSLREHMTVVVIAHRMTTIDLCDTIMVVEDGHVINSGPPRELKLSNDFYRRALELSKTETS